MIEKESSQGISTIQFIDIKNGNGQTEYVFSANLATNHSTNLVDFYNPIIMFILGLIIASVICYLIYYLRKINVKIRMEDVYGCMGMLGVCLLVGGLIAILFVGMDGLIYPILGLLFIFAGGSMLTDQQKESSTKC